MRARNLFFAGCIFTAGFLTGMEYTLYDVGSELREIENRLEEVEERYQEKQKDKNNYELPQNSVVFETA